MRKKINAIGAFLKSWSEVIIILIQVVFLVMLFIQTRDIKNSQVVNNLITLNQQVYPCPKINEIVNAMTKGEDLFEVTGGKYSRVEIDNFLGYFEMIGLIEKEGYLDFEVIDNMFGYDIEEIFNNRELCEYIKSDEKASWPNLRKLYKKIVKKK